MFKPGDLVRIKNANEMWQHLVGQIGVFISEAPGEPFPKIVKPIHCACQVRFTEEDLEYICSGEDVRNIMRDEHI